MDVWSGVVVGRRTNFSAPAVRLRELQQASETRMTTIGAIR